MFLSVMRLIARCRGLLSRRRAEAELSDELEFHIESQTAANLAAGMSETEARRAALRALGGLVQTTEAVRDVRALWLEAVWRDIGHACRSLRASPSFTIVAISLLAVSVGACVAVFSVVDAVVLRGLPFERADRLVAVGEQVRTDRSTDALNLVAPQNFVDWRERQRAFTDLAASAWAQISVQGAAGTFPEKLAARRVTASLFTVLGTAPVVGGPFTAANEVAGREHVAVISYGLWQRRFAGRPDIVGQLLPGQLASFEIVGVMPRGFSYPVASAEAVDVWVPYVVGPDEHVRGHSYGYYLQVVGRLREGVSVAMAQAQMDQITRELAAETPQWFEDRVARVEDLQDYLTRGVRTWMLMLLGAAGCVLLIAGVNLANLMLARVSWRRRELRLRAALGASFRSLTQIVLVESLVVSISGATIGTGLAFWAVGVVRSGLPETLPRVASIAVDVRVLAATFVTAVGMGLVIGMAPIVRFVRPAVSGRLVPQTRADTGDRGTTWLRVGLIVAEVAGAVTLLVGAGLFLDSFRRVTAIDLGFDYRNVLTVQFRPLVLPQQATPGPAPLVAILERARALPDVEAAALTGEGVPLRGDLLTRDFTIPNATPPKEGDIAINAVSPEYFRTLRVPLRKGRGVEAQDQPGTLPVVVLNERASRMLFGGDQAIGQTMHWRGERVARTVVGIVGNIRYDGPENDVRPQAFIPFAQGRGAAATLLLRTRPGAPAVLGDIRAAFASAYPPSAGPVSVDVQTLEYFVRDLLAQRRLNMWLLAAFGGLGLAIASVGLFGVLGYMVAQRTQEFGIRMALGASPPAILGGVLVHAARYVAFGTAVGLAGAWTLATLVQSLLFGTPAHAPVIYAIAASLVASVSLVAVVVPAWRAAKIDPLIALRVDW